MVSNITRSKRVTLLIAYDLTITIGEQTILNTILTVTGEAFRTIWVIESTLVGGIDSSIATICTIDTLCVTSIINATGQVTQSCSTTCASHGGIAHTATATGRIIITRKTSAAVTVSAIGTIIGATSHHAVADSHASTTSQHRLRLGLLTSLSTTRDVGVHELIDKACNCLINSTNKGATQLHSQDGEDKHTSRSNQGDQDTYSHRVLCCQTCYCSLNTKGSQLTVFTIAQELRHWCLNQGWNSHQELLDQSVDKQSTKQLQEKGNCIYNNLSNTAHKTHSGKRYSRNQRDSALDGVKQQGQSITETNHDEANQQGHRAEPVNQLHSTRANSAHRRVHSTRVNGRRHTRTVDRPCLIIKASIEIVIQTQQRHITVRWRTIEVQRTLLAGDITSRTFLITRATERYSVICTIRISDITAIGCSAIFHTTSVKTTVLYIHQRIRCRGITKVDCLSHTTQRIVAFLSRLLTLRVDLLCSIPLRNPLNWGRYSIRCAKIGLLIILTTFTVLFRILLLAIFSSQVTGHRVIQSSTRDTGIIFITV